MKKFFKEFFKVLLIASLILGISFTIFVLYFSHKNFVHGKVLVENEDFVIDKALTAGYEADEFKSEAVKSKTIENGISFEHRGSAGHYLYTYKFTITGEEFSVHPIIHWVKLSSFENENIKFVFKFYESDDVWNATVDYFDGNSLRGTVDIEDVEKNGIEVQFTQA